MVHSLTSLVPSPISPLLPRASYFPAIPALDSTAVVASIPSHLLQIVNSKCAYMTVAAHFSSLCCDTALVLLQLFDASLKLVNLAALAAAYAEVGLGWAKAWTKYRGRGKFSVPSHSSFLSLSSFVLSRRTLY